MRIGSIIAVVLLSFFPEAPSLSAAEKRPNVIFLMADDMGIGDLGCYNPASKVPTPNMDRLAKQGMRFIDAHSPSGVCTPTRYGVMTGRYSWRGRLKSGVLRGFSPLLIEKDRMTVASLMKRSGYHTGCVGKWHLGLGNREKTDYSKPLSPGPRSVGFDYYFGIPASLDMEPYVFVENEKPLEAPTETIKASKMRRLGGNGFWRAGPIAPSFKHEDVLPKITEKAVAFIEKHGKDSEKPFFLYFPLSAPHTPWLPTKEFQGKSKAGPYGDFTVQVDATVGRILETLDQLKIADDTLIIVTSDNGAHWRETDIKEFGHRANHQLRGQKADIWEGGHRVAFLARWPGRIKAGAVCDQTVCHVDLMATLASLLGEKLPDGAGEDSESLLPAFLGKQGDEPIHEAVIHHSSRGVFAIRKGDWKLIDGLGSGGFSTPRTRKPQPGGPKGQLYNLAKDGGETTNLYLKHPEVVKQLSALLQGYKGQGHSARRLRVSGE